jgi:hypothetical protein
MLRRMCSSYTLRRFMLSMMLLFHAHVVLLSSYHQYFMLHGYDVRYYITIILMPLQQQQYSMHSTF